MFSSSRHRSLLSQISKVNRATRDLRKRRRTSIRGTWQGEGNETQPVLATATATLVCSPGYRAIAIIDNDQTPGFSIRGPLAGRALAIWPARIARPRPGPTEPITPGRGFPSSRARCHRPRPDRHHPPGRRPPGGRDGCLGEPCRTGGGRVGDTGLLPSGRGLVTRHAQGRVVPRVPAERNADRAVGHEGGGSRKQEARRGLLAVSNDSRGSQDRGRRMLDGFDEPTGKPRSIEPIDIS